MAYSNRGSNLPGIVAAVDLSSAQHRFVTIDSGGEAALAAAAGRIDGVNAGNPAQGVAVPIEGPGSVSKVEASAAITAGDSVGSAANGQARTAVINDFIAGAALNSVSNAGELVSVWLTMPGISL